MLYKIIGDSCMDLTEELKLERTLIAPGVHLSCDPASNG